MSSIQSIILKVRSDNFLSVGRINHSDIQNIPDSITKEILFNIFDFDLISTEREIEEEFSFHLENTGFLTYHEFKSYLSTMGEKDILSSTNLISIQKKSNTVLPDNVVKEILELLKPISEEKNCNVWKEVDIYNLFNSYIPKNNDLKVSTEISNSLF